MRCPKYTARTRLCLKLSLVSYRIGSKEQLASARGSRKQSPRLGGRGSGARTRRPQATSDACDRVQRPPVSGLKATVPTRSKRHARLLAVSRWRKVIALVKSGK
jgi:hypothetical protein